MNQQQAENFIYDADRQLGRRNVDWSDLEAIEDRALELIGTAKPYQDRATLQRLTGILRRVERRLGS